MSVKSKRSHVRTALCTAGVTALLVLGVSVASAEQPAETAEAQGAYSPAVQALFDADAAKFETVASNDNTFASRTKYAADQPEPAQSAANAGMDPQAVPYVSEQYIADNTPHVTVLEDGTQIQTVPNDIGYDTYKLVDFMPSYNLYYLNGEHRGCNACHDDLAELVSNMDDFDHQDITRCAPVQYTVQMCIDCHTWQPGYITQQYNFGDLIHNVHNNLHGDAFTAMGGDCWSCHIVQDSSTTDTLSTNDMVALPMFDEYKHRDIMRKLSK